MIAGSRFRGEFEEASKSGDRRSAALPPVEIILFIDELHTVVGAGAAQGAMDASNMLKPALARGELQCVGANNLDEYHISLSKKTPPSNGVLLQYFVEEPSVEDTISMLRGSA